MKKKLILALAAGATFAAAAPADAAQGCGRGFHRGWHNQCRPDRGGPIAGPGLRVGIFYPGQGYWDGHRYWQHRDRWHGGWRYR